MKTKLSLLWITLAVTFVVSEGLASACPCSPCTCSPCHCGGGGGKGGKHHGKDDHHHHHDGGVGVGVGVDLGGVGHRSREADPFATGGGSEPVAHTQEKHKTKTKEREVTTSNPFTGIKLTGKEAKAEASKPAEAASNP